MTQYIDDPRYFLFFNSSKQITGNIPQGELYSKLHQIGSGKQLKKLEQTIGQLGTGYLGWFNYSLAATLDTSDRPGIEKMAYATQFFIVNMEFMSIKVGDSNIYVPIQE